MKTLRILMCLALIMAFICPACMSEEILSGPAEADATEYEAIDLYAPEIRAEGVDETGAFLAPGEGASVNGETAVSAPGEECPPDEAAAISAPGLYVDKSSAVIPTSIKLGVKETYRIPKGKYGGLTYTSSKKSVALVSSAGKITGKSVGTAYVTVKSNGRKVARIKVRVRARPGWVKLSRTKTSITVGASRTLKVTLPEGTASAIRFSTSNSSVAKVNSSGKVTAVSPGEAKITAATYNGKKASCRVSVSAKSGVAIQYDANGGTGAPAGFTVAPDSSGVITFSHPSTKPKRSGHTFLGWMCEYYELYYPLDSAGQTIRFQISSGTLHYTAQWMPDSHPKHAPYLVATTLHPDGNKYDIIEGQWHCIQKAEATYWAMHNWYNASGEFTGIEDGSGYAGFQYGDGKTFVIMSIWDTDRGSARIEYYKAGAKAEPFGGEGDGMHVQTPYPWREDTWYTMRIQAWSDDSRTYYEQWVKPENGSWELIAIISYSRPGLGFTWDCFFQEDWIGNNALRSCQLRGYYARRADTQNWVSLDQYTLTNSCGGASNVRYDCDYANIDDSTVWVKTGGDGYADKALQMPATLKVSQSTLPREPGFLVAK